MEPFSYDTSENSSHGAANRAIYANTSATAALLSQPRLPSKTGDPSSKRRRRRTTPKYLRSLIAATLRAKFSNISQRTAVKCVNRICNDPDSNAGAAGEEGTLTQQSFSGRLKNFMGDIKWPWKGAPITPEYHEKLREGMEAYGDGKEDLICRLADLAAENMDSVTLEELNLTNIEKTKSTAAPRASGVFPIPFQTPRNQAITTKSTLFTIETLTGVSNAVRVTPAPVSDSAARVNAMAATLPQRRLPFVKVRSAVPITTIQGTKPDISLHHAAIPRPLPTNIAQPRPTAPVRNACATKPNAVGLVLKQEAFHVPQGILKTENIQNIDIRHGNPGSGTTAVPVPSQPSQPTISAVNSLTNQQVMELEKRWGNIQEDAKTLPADAREIQQLKDQLEAKEAKFLEKQTRILTWKQAVAEQRKKAREMLEKELEQEEKVLKDNEAKMAAWVRRVEAGKKRKREYEERLAALEYESKIE